MSPKGRKRNQHLCYTVNSISVFIMKQKLHAISHWIQQHRTRTILVISALLIASAGGVAYALLSQPQPEPTPVASVSKPKPVVKYYSPLTGREVTDEAATKQAVTAVMIENSPDARPQSGLKEAGIVFEAVAEGGITRFLALYQEDKPTLIGPVRSLRPYYLSWAAGYDASIAHVGGSKEALDEVRNGSYRDIDQFFNANTYWRATDRYAPHNVYTNFEKLDALNQAKGYTSSTFEGFARQDGKTASEVNATSVNINLSGALYNTSYSYDGATNTYKRSLAGEPHNDREKGQITPDVVIALKVDQASGYYRNVTTIGSGEVVIFQNGSATTAAWHKASQREPLRITDSNGNPVLLNRGRTWIAAVPNGQGSVSWQ